MTDYISRADAINEIMNDMVENATTDDKIYNTGLHRAMSRIDNIPAADVAPVVHGRWIKVDGLVACSVCKENPPRTYHNFCPNCGAKMDGGAKDAID